MDLRDIQVIMFTIKILYGHPVPSLYTQTGLEVVSGI